MVNFKKKGKGREIKNQKKRMKEIIEKFYPSNYRERALQIIDNIQSYIRRNYYNDKTIETFEEEINDFIGSEYSLRDNYKFSKILKNNEDWIKTKGYYIEKEKGKDSVFKLSKSPKIDNFLENTKEMARFNKNEMDRIFVGQSESNIMKIEILMNRLREIAEENKWKALERKSIIQILTLEPNLDKKFIDNTLNELINEGILIEKENNFIQFKEK